MKGVAAKKRVQVNWTNRSPETVEGCRASSSIVSHGLAEGMFSTRGSTRRCQQGLQVDVAAVDPSAQSWTNNVGPAIDHPDDLQVVRRAPHQRSDTFHHCVLNGTRKFDVRRETYHHLITLT